MVHHIAQFLTGLPEWVHAYARLGAYGVDLFFVLSGWLIGGLYWKELERNKSVEIVRFWFRRWLRTVPPYLFILPIAYLAVNLSRGEVFDFRYLLFLQNYETKIPFFLISWSLCVEEHFYFFLPLVLLFTTRIKIRPIVFLPILASMSLLFRIVDPLAVPNSSFGYAETATHIRFEGLVIGVWLAYVNIKNLNLWLVLQKLSRYCFSPMILGYLTIPNWPQNYIYYFSYVYMAMTWAVVLVALLSIATLKISLFPSVQKTALWSYSIYLTHSLVIHICVNLADRLNINRETTLPFWVVSIFSVGFIVYKFVEVPSMNFRDRFVPRRGFNIGSKTL